MVLVRQLCVIPLILILPLPLSSSGGRGQSLNLSVCKEEMTVPASQVAVRTALISTLERCLARVGWLC